MHDDEVDVDLGLVRRLLSAQFPQWAELPLERVEPAGTDNAIFRLGEDKSVRMPRIHWATRQPELEHTWLPRLAPHLPLPVPVPLALGEPGEGYPFPWAVNSWLPGRIDVDEAPDASAFAEFVAAIQKVDTSGAPAAHRGAPLGDTERAREAIEQLGDDALAVWEEALAAPRWDRPPVWIHGDLDRRNLLVADGRICGVIDFSCAGIGDPAHDIGAAWRVVGRSDRDGFLERLGADDATLARAKGWIVLQAANALAYYTVESNPTLVHEARRWLGEVL
jgi:aminoglycoside phosphotransferase (APT) family kinase protein